MSKSETKYKKAYAFLLGRMDETLTFMENDDRKKKIVLKKAQEMLVRAMEDAEEMFVGDEHY